MSTPAMIPPCCLPGGTHPLPAPPSRDATRQPTTAPVKPKKAGAR
jgi:hypothetical protein